MDTNDQAVEPAQATDVNETGAVDQSTGVTEVPAAEVQVPEQTGVDGAADQNQEPMIPLSAKQDEVRKRQLVEEQNAYLIQQLRQQQNQQPAQKPSEAIAKQYGLDPDGLVEAGQLAEILAQERANIMQGLQGLQFQSAHTDYKEVVGDGQQFAAPLAERLKSNPMLAQALQKSPEWQTLAYEIGSLQKQLEQAKAGKAQTAQQAVQETINNATRVMTPGAAGASGAVSGSQYDGMSSDDFNAAVEKIKRNG